MYIKTNAPKDIKMHSTVNFITSRVKQSKEEEILHSQTGTEDHTTTIRMSLPNQVAIVTGGSKGIGRAISIKLAALGASVVVNYGRDSAAAEEVVAHIGQDKGLAVQADAGSITGVETLVKAAVEKFGRIDIVVANAGIMPMADLEHTTAELFDKVMNLNVKGPFFLAQVSSLSFKEYKPNKTQKAAPHMAPGSHLILVSTTLCVASTVAPGYLPYLVSKGAIEQMTRVMAKDLGRKGIRVNAVAPGPTGTDLFLEGKSPELIKGIASATPFQKLGEPDEIADVVAFLSGEGSRWISGQIVRVNGAMA
jgi:3-oxoacyl-[acyl-carrier protein] reductase